MSQPELSPVAKWYSEGFGDDYNNARGIPKVEFVEDVGAYLKKKDMTAEGSLKKMQEQYSKYKLMEYKLNQNKTAYKAKIPEINKTLTMLNHLKKKIIEDEEDIDTWFGLSDTVFAQAETRELPKTVGLWLGASTMVEYSHQEAIELLSKNLASATTNLESTIEDLAFLRDQLTVSEVNMARLYNWQVKENRRQKQQNK